MVWSDEEFVSNNIVNVLQENCRECLKYNMFREYCSKFTQVTICGVEHILLISHTPGTGQEQWDEAADVDCDNRQRNTGRVTTR